MINNKKVIVIMPAYNAEKTLERTYRDIDLNIVDEIILCDDASTDATVETAKRLGLTALVHEKNKGYGANQKTAYREAIKRGADIIVMIHPDYQYDAARIREMVGPIAEGKFDCMFGSRMADGGALNGGMPIYKFISNKFLTFFENLVFKYGLSEYHTGLRAYKRQILEKIPWQLNSDGFLFDTQIIAQMASAGFKIGEIAVETRYFKEASQVGPIAGIKYGLGTLVVLIKYIFHKISRYKCAQFEVVK